MEFFDPTKGSKQFCFHLHGLIPVSAEAFYVIGIMQSSPETLLTTKLRGLHMGTGETLTE